MYDAIESTILRATTVFAGYSAMQNGSIWPLVIPLIWIVEIFRDTTIKKLMAEVKRKNSWNSFDMGMQYLSRTKSNPSDRELAKYFRVFRVCGFIGGCVKPIFFCMMGAAMTIELYFLPILIAACIITGLKARSRYADSIKDAKEEK